MSLERRSAKAQVIKPKRGIINFFIFAAVLCTGVALAWSTITTNIEVENNAARIAVLSDQITILEDENAQIERYLNNPEALKEYMEQKAREKFNYAYENEVVYYIVPSTDIQEVTAAE